MPITETMGSIVALALGLVVGSFLNVVIYRLPRRQSIVFPGSHCTNCGFTLKWYHNIPVFSYLALGGKCAQCGERISLIYPLVELLTGGITVLLFIKFGVSLTFLFLFLFCVSLVAISFIDLEFQIIPDSISLPGIIVGFGSSFLRPDLGVMDSLIGAVAGGGILLLIFFGYYAVTKREGMGMGDVKLLAMIGAFLGWRSLLFIILASSFMGAIIGGVLMVARKQDSKLAIPFGPFLSLGATLYLFAGQDLINWYFDLLL